MPSAPRMSSANCFGFLGRGWPCASVCAGAAASSAAEGGTFSAESPEVMAAYDAVHVLESQASGGFWPLERERHVEERADRTVHGVACRTEFPAEGNTLQRRIVFPVTGR